MIQTEKEYNAIVERIETLLQDNDNIENTEAKGYIELNLLSDLVAGQCFSCVDKLFSEY